MFVDPASKQTFAQAFDAVAGALRDGQAAATPRSRCSKTSFPGLANCRARRPRRRIVVSKRRQFHERQPGQDLPEPRRLPALAWPAAATNDQALVEFMRTYIGESNYNAGSAIAKRREPWPDPWRELHVLARPR